MAQELGRIGSMSAPDFDRRCREIVLNMAKGVRRDVGRATVRRKDSYAGVKGGDVVTSADENAQRLFVELATRWLPKGVGWIGEEGGLRKPSTFRPRVVVTVDPADGTRKLIEAMRAKRQLVPGEVSSMLGVLVNGQPVATYVCDVSNLVTYTRRPNGKALNRVLADGAEVNTARIPGKPKSLAAGVLLRHGTRPIANPLTNRLINDMCGGYEEGGSSIGLSVARILTGDLVALLRVSGGFTTPWDDTPIEAMCSQGDIVGLRVGRDRLYPAKVRPLHKTTPRSYDLLYVGRQYLPELRKLVRVEV